MQNAYFKITSDGSKFGLLLEPPKNGGEPLNIAEVMDYLKEQGMVCLLYTSPSPRDA